MTSIAEETLRLDQALADLTGCGAASVALIHCPSEARERAAVRELVGRARERGFAVALVSLREHGLQAPEELVRQVIERLVPPGEGRGRGLFALVDRFRAEHGAEAVARFAAAVEEHDADGDLAELARGALASTERAEGSSARRAIAAWLDGVEPARKHKNRAVRRALSERTAQRSLDDLSRLVRALGHQGTLIVLTEGDALAARTERQREKGYTVLRELVDNFDASGGAVAARVLLTGQAPLFEGAASLRSIVPLRMRLETPSAAAPPPPHRPWTALDDGAEPAARRRAVRKPDGDDGALRNLIRIAQGVPPTDRVTRMSVGQERLDRTIARLFTLVKRAGSFFSILMGEYGSGKTHLMMHLAERALEDQRPVFWLNLERTNLDLGNPARHLQRFLEHSRLPSRGRPSALDLLGRWTRSKAALGKLEAALAAIAADDGEAATAARKAIRIVESARDRGFALDSFLGGHDLAERPGDPPYRLDAYRRIFLWFELLARLEEIRGPMILIDEAENLYTSGRAPASRRTSLRSLAFYCGGALPGTGVVLAMTPPAYEQMKGEARDLLAEAGEIESTLELERVERFRRSLWGLKPEPVKALSKAEREELCDRVKKMHRAARGATDVAGWSAIVARLVAEHTSPRTLIRALIDELEAAWWA
jgi:hypothetical protein